MILGTPAAPTLETPRLILRCWRPDDFPAKAAIGWSFETFPLDRIVSIIDPRNRASRRVAERLGERPTGERFTPFQEPCDVWEMRRENWPAS